jgi:hypothetical protein
MRLTPKEKAEQLTNKFLLSTPITCDIEDAKRCALVAVDEIIEAIDFDWMEVQNLESEHRYWEQVKQEIEKL